MAAESAIHRAARDGDLERVRELLDAQAGLLNALENPA